MLKFKIDSEAIASEFGAFAADVKKDLQESMEKLAAIMKGKTLELASAKLKSTYPTYEKNLSMEKVIDGVWTVTLHEKGMFLEEGIEANFDMKPGLLKSGTKTSKSGNKYRSIPFNHGKNTPTTATPKAMELVGQIKKALKAEKIPYKKIERDATGNPRLGMLHKLNIPSEKPTLRASTPALRGLTIYQHKQPNGKISRSIMTFRTVSSGPASQGKWIHPGMAKNEFMDKAFAWAEQVFQNEILPDILKKYG